MLLERSPTLLYADQEILKGVRVVSLPGHTPGTTGLLVQLDHTALVLLTDDEMYTHETYGPPAVGTPNTWDVQCWNASIEKIRKLATEHSAFLFPGHDETGIKVRDQHATEFKEDRVSPLLTRLLLRVESDRSDNACRCGSFRGPPGRKGRIRAQRVGDWVSAGVAVIYSGYVTADP